MKYFLSIIIIALLAILPAVGQQIEISYTYDASGNRTSRSIDTVQQKSLAFVQNSQYSLQLLLPRELSDRDIRLYPNPTAGQVVVEITGDRKFKQSTIQVLDLTGRLLRHMENLTPVNVINLASYPAGTYIIRVSLAGANGEWKVVKE